MSRCLEAIFSSRSLIDVPKIQERLSPLFKAEPLLVPNTTPETPTSAPNPEEKQQQQSSETETKPETGS